MMNIRKSKAAKAVVIATSLFFFVSQSGAANAATKTITCYKGTASKKVSTAKCPTGWSTTKPVAGKPAAGATSAKTVAINGNYSGTV